MRRGAGGVACSQSPPVGGERNHAVTEPQREAAAIAAQREGILSQGDAQRLQRQGWHRLRREAEHQRQAAHALIPPAENAESCRCRQRPVRAAPD
jgi:hypothetical protein